MVVWFGLLWCIRLLSALVIGHVGHVGHVGGSIPLSAVSSKQQVTIVFQVTISPDDVVRLSDGFQYEISTLTWRELRILHVCAEHALFVSIFSQVFSDSLDFCLKQSK